jgi:hypothetical protein
MKELMDKKDIVICDLDGTLADCEHRRHWLDKEQHGELSLDERWRNFFADCPQDKPRWPLIQVVQMLCLAGTRIRTVIDRCAATTDTHRQCP